MAKNETLNPEIQELVDKIADEFGLNQQMGIEVIAVASQPQLIKVGKATNGEEYFARKSDFITLRIYQKAFELLEPRQQELLIRDALLGVYYDLDKDRIVTKTPTVTITENGYKAHGTELVDAAIVGVNTIIHIKEMEREAKKAEREAKKEAAKAKKQK